MSWGKLAGNVLGTAIVLGVTEKYILRPLIKKKKKKKGGIILDDLYKI